MRSASMSPAWASLGHSSLDAGVAGLAQWPSRRVSITRALLSTPRSSSWRRESRLWRPSRGSAACGRDAPRLLGITFVRQSSVLVLRFSVPLPSLAFSFSASPPKQSEKVPCPGSSARCVAPRGGVGATPFHSMRVRRFLRCCVGQWENGVWRRLPCTGKTEKGCPHSTRDGTRTHNLLLRREAPYPLGHTSRCTCRFAHRSRRVA